MRIPCDKCKNGYLVVTTTLNVKYYTCSECGFTTKWGNHK